MELKLVTGQDFTSIQHAYHEYAQDYTDPETFEAGWVKLIKHLEQIEWPPQWVTVSQYLLFIMEVDTQEISRARVQISSLGHHHSGSEFYEITYRVPDDEAPWENSDDNVMGTWMRGTAHSVEAAGRMIVIALERAATVLVHNPQWNTFPS